MQKQAPTVGRLLVMVGFALSCFGLLLFLWLAFGGPTPLEPKGYRFTTSFGEATQLAKEADVRISGVSVGKVKSIATQPDGRSKAVIQLDQQYAPIPKNTRAILRQKTLLGETYVELTPGDRSSGPLPENGTIPASQVSQTVELDEIYRAFDKPTRTAFRTWMQTRRRRWSAAAPTSTTRWATSRRSPRTRRGCWRSSTPRRARRASSSATPAPSSTRCRSATISCAR